MSNGEKVHQYRTQHCSDWYDGYPDESDGGGPYEVRTLYRAAQASTIVALKEQLSRAERALVRGGFVDHGAAEWKPPIGKPPLFIACGSALRAEPAGQHDAALVALLARIDGAAEALCFEQYGSESGDATFDREIAIKEIIGLRADYAIACDELASGFREGRNASDNSAENPAAIRALASQPAAPVQQTGDVRKAEAVEAIAHRWAQASYNKALNRPFEDIDSIRKELRQALATTRPSAALTDEQIGDLYIDHAFTEASDREISFARAILAASSGAVAVPEWISVDDERKPVGRTPILVAASFVRYGEHEDGTPGEYHGVEVAEGEYIPGHGERECYFASYQGQIGDASHVTHWMPLPAAPTTPAQGQTK